MAKPKKDADRRAVVEQLRREQQRKERRQGLLVLGAAGTVGALIIGVAAWQFLESEKRDSRDLAAIGSSISDAGCEEVEKTPAEGNNDHRAEGEKILYKEAPPASGPHWGNFLVGSQIRTIFTADDRPPVERLVHSLEHGHTILWYDETIAGDDEAMADLRSVARKFDSDDKFMAAPWTEADGQPFPEGTHLALTHWSVNKTFDDQSDDVGVTQYCSAVSGEAVGKFLDDYPSSDAPEPNAP